MPLVERKLKERRWGMQSQTEQPSLYEEIKGNYNKCLIILQELKEGDRNES